MSSPFAVRGVIEGFYGNPYTGEQRLALVDFLPGHGFNTFIYGPKDDPLVRARWREPYTGERLARLGTLISRCHERGIAFVGCISPGLSIRYSDADDVATLCARLDGLVALGADGVALLLEDIPAVLQHGEDRAAFADLADAHVALVNAIRKHLGPDAWLIVCPWTYWGRGTEPYLERLGAATDPSIDLFWTGRAICSTTLDLVDAAIFERTARRGPLYWDNYPVNDVAMGWELHIGPYLGRDPELGVIARGVVANPMELFEASRIPLATIGDY
ncbi:MAG: beta-N-acetylglucosaminidase domain-containing protein, partial [Chloroflexota bacterium]